MLAQIAPLYSVYKAPSYQPDFILLALVSIKLAYQSMLFILELAYNAGSADQLKNKHVQLSRVWKKKNDTIRVESDSYDGAWYAENISTAFVTKTQVSDEWNQCLSATVNIWKKVSYWCLMVGPVPDSICSMDFPVMNPNSTPR